MCCATAYGDGVGFTYGWATFFLGFAAPTALIAHACIVYLLMPWQSRVIAAGYAWPEWITPAGASVVILSLTALHCRGQRASAWVQNLTTAFKFLLLSLFVVAGWIVGDWSQWSAGRAISEQEVGTAVVSLVYVFYAYLGWNASVYLAGEIEQPSKSLPRAILGGCVLVTLLYLAINVTYILGVGPEGLRDATPAQVEAIAETAGRRLFGPARLRRVVDVDRLRNSGVRECISADWLPHCFAMAADGLFPAYGSRLSATAGVPRNAIVTLGLSAVALLWMSQWVAGAADAFRSLLNYTTVGLVLLTSLAVSSLFVLRRRVQVSSFRVPWYPVPPFLFLGVTGVLMVYAIKLNPQPTLWGTASILSGWPVYRLTRWWRRSS